MKRLLHLTKQVIASFLYNTGLFWLLNKIRNRNYLTVAMFHRVLPHDDDRFDGADPLYTIEPDDFKTCLEFFQRYYNIVSLGDLERYINEKTPLPLNSLLLTFDDGWKDNFDYAFPILKSYSIPSVIFVVTDFIGSHDEFWQEKILSEITKSDPNNNLIQIISTELNMPVPENYDSYIWAKKAIHKLSNNKEVREKILLMDVYRDKETPRAMMNKLEYLSALKDDVSIGAHGKSHTPITIAEDPSEELNNSLKSLRTIFGEIKPITSMSFPHGAYDNEVRSLAIEANYDFLFSSEHCINATENIKSGNVFGRIEVTGYQNMAQSERWTKLGLAKRFILCPQKRIT